MSKTHEQVVQELDAKIPRDAISSREGGGRSKLSYLEGWYVIDRLNKTLGIGNWAYSADANLVYTDTANNSVHYTAKVRLVVKFPNGETTEFADYGYGDGSDKYKIGKAHELAVKEAVTDGIKRCAKNLGMSLGLALYDKTQENVEDAPAFAPTRDGQRKVAEAVVARPAITQEVVAPVDEPQTDPGAVGPRSEGTRRYDDRPTAPILTGSAAAREALNKKITAMSKVVIAKKLKTLDELKAEMKSKYGAESTAALTAPQATELYSNLEKLAHGV